MIYKRTYFTGYADDSTSFVVGDGTTDALKALEYKSAKISKNRFQITG